MTKIMKLIPENPNTNDKMNKGDNLSPSDMVVKNNDILSNRIYSCPCCGLMMSVEYCRHVVCPKCEWIEDPEQLDDHDLSEGRNAMSLNEAKAAFRKSQVYV
ncbi:CPCC family cysteine-rich protein [Citrobacter amalonaticus]|nr:CPCC family cysteine-rich protein [Citrobacter amalonaticus]